MKFNLINTFVALLILICLGCKYQKENPPNVIIILTDDQGWGDLSIKGNLDLSTPNIDKLGRTGVQFDRFFVSPVCSPTRAELLTGRYHVRGGVYSTSTGGERLDIDEQTIAQIFKKAGYSTAAYGKWHNGMQAPYHPNSRGFDDYYGFCSGHWGNYYNPLLEHNGNLVKGEGFIIDDLTNHGIDFIKKNKANPFFLYLPLNTPHSPMQVPDVFWEKFKDKTLSQMGSNGPFKTQHEIDHTRAALSMCENIDWNVGRILEQVEREGLSKNTIVIYLSDNGPNGKRWNDEMKGIKGTTDEGGVRSPLIMNWKGKIPQGKIIKKITSVIDLLPTLKDLVGIKVKSKKPLDGISLKPLILNKTVNWQDRIIYNYWKGRFSVRSQNYRLDKDNKLFDMLNDPNQTTDISEKQTEVLEKLFQAKKQWKKEVLVELPKKDIRPFVIGHHSVQTTQIPARDGKAHGAIVRSNRYPNCTYFTNWINIEDKITWEVEVAKAGSFEVIIYYTCMRDAIGSEFEISFGSDSILGKISEKHNPNEYGATEDRSLRTESYVKDFKPLNIGVINLEKGPGTLSLKAIKKNGESLMDFRLMLFKRI